MNHLRVAMRLGFLDLLHHRRLVIVMSLSIAITIALLACVEVYRAGLQNKYTELAPEFLLVHESQTLGEFYGSRMPITVQDELIGLGISQVIPELRAVAGTSAENAVLVRGLDLERYTQLESFSIVSGRKLIPGENPRNTMIGWRLALSRGLEVGDTIALRGRNFTIAGIFKNGTYMDNQAWISLPDAQALLGWGQDVSVFIIPDEGIVKEGDIILEGITVTRKGESLEFTLEQYEPLFKLLHLVVLILAAASALALTNILLRLAWLRRREMAVLRSNGFPAIFLAEYLFTQSASITTLGVMFGALLTILLTAGIKLAIPAFTLVPRLEAGAALMVLASACIMAAAGGILPAWWLSRMNLAAQLHPE